MSFRVPSSRPDLFSFRSLFGQEQSWTKRFGLIVIALLLIAFTGYRVSAQSAPSHDNFANALTITGISGTATGTNVNATKETLEPSHAGFVLKSVWYKWTPTISAPVMVTTVGSGFDTVLGVYTGTAVGSLTPVGSNDDYNGWSSRVEFNAVAGTTYRIAVDGHAGASGTITLNWSEQPPMYPTSLSAVAGNNQTTLSWVGSTGAATYQIFRSTTMAYPEPANLLNTVTAPTTTYIDNTAVNGTGYSYTVWAVNSGGTSAATPYAYAKPAASFGAPTAIRLEGQVSAGNIAPKIFWYTTTGAASYRIYRRTADQQTGTQVGTATSQASFWQDGSLTATGSPTYVYFVAAVNSGGTVSARSNELSITTGFPQPPTNVVATPGNTQISVTWTPVDYATSYYVTRYKYSGTSPLNWGTFTNTANSFVDTGLVNGEKYYYTIQTQNPAGQSGIANSNDAIPTSTPPTLPAAPVGVTAVASLDSQNIPKVVLNWTAVSGAIAYRISRSTTSDGQFTTIGDSATTTFTNSSVYDEASNLSPVVPGRTYYYQVQSFKSPNYGNPSTLVRVTTAPAAPLFSGLENNKVNVHLPPLPAGATSYTLYRATQASPPAAPTTGLAAWYRADSLLATGKVTGDGIEEWVDLSGNRLNAAADGSFSRPVLAANGENARPSLRFDGLRSALRLPPGFANLTTGFSVFAVIKPRNLNESGSTRVLDLSTMGDFDQLEETIYMGSFDGDKFSYGVKNTEVAASVGVLTNQFDVVGAIQQAGAVGSSTSTVLRVKGVDVSLSTATAVIPANIIRTHNGIGNRMKAATGIPFDGEIAELLIYNQALSAANRLQLEQYLARRYSLPGTLANLASTPTLTWTSVASNLAGGSTYQDSGLTAKTSYWYRVQATVSDSVQAPATVTGVSSFVTTLSTPLTSTAGRTPTFASTSTTATTVGMSPTGFPAGTDFLLLQRKLASEPNNAYRTVAVLRSGGATTATVSDLQSATSYKFRFVSVVDSYSYIGTEASVTTLSATAGGGGGLHATYYDNLDFTKRIDYITDSTVNFDWAGFAPTQRMDSNAFSIRWQGQIQPQYSENYIFHAPVGADDSVRVWVNGNKIIDHTESGGSVDSAAVALVANQKYDIQVDYVEKYGNAAVKLEWESTSQARQVVPSNRLFVPNIAGTIGSGLRGQYFNGYFFSNQAMVRTDSQLDFGFPANVVDPKLGGRPFSILWTGQIKPRYTQTYTYTLRANGSVRLWVNNVEQTLTSVNATDSTATVSMTAGSTPNIKVAYSGNPAVKEPHVELLWQSTSQALQTVPYFCLIPATVNDPSPPTFTGDSAESMGTTLPSNLVLGTPTTGTVTFKNRGTTTWTGPRFILKQYETYWGLAPAADGTQYYAQIFNYATQQQFPISGSVAPNAQTTISVSVNPSPSTVGIVWYIEDTNKPFPSSLVNESAYQAVTLSTLLPPPEVVKTESNLVRLKMPNLPSGSTSFRLERATGVASTIDTSLPTTNMSLWWRADSLGLPNSTPVQFWKNAAGTTKATQTSAINAPVLLENGPQGRPVVHFDGINDWLSTNVTGPGGTAVTVFAMVKSPSIGQYQSILRFEDGTGYAVYPTGPHRWTVSNNAANYAAAGLVPNVWNIGVAQWASGQTYKSWRNGALVDSQSANTSTLPSVPLTIGSFPGGGSDFFQGDLAELIVYNRTLTDAERQKVETYLGQKYSVRSASMPVASGYTSIATGLTSGEVYDDTTALPSTTYWYRVVPLAAAGTASEGALATTESPLPAAPGVPGAPVSGAVTETTIAVVAPGPSWPTNTTGLQLQMRLPTQTDADYADTGSPVAPSETVTVRGLVAETMYRFRFVAVGRGGRTASTSSLDITTVLSAPAKPDKPVLNEYVPDPTSQYKYQVKLGLPYMPDRATSLKLEWNGGSGSTFTTVPEGTVAIGTPVAVPGSTNQGEYSEILVTELWKYNYAYTFRVVAVGPGGTTPGDNLSVNGSVYTDAPGMPPEPKITGVGGTWVTILGAAKPANTSQLYLQIRLVDDYNAQWTTLTSSTVPGEDWPVTELTRGGSFEFRWVAYKPGGDQYTGGTTYGPSVIVTLNDLFVLWRAGSPIECKGIRWPASGFSMAKNTTTKFAAFAGTDFDSRDVLPEGAPIAAMDSYRFTDRCTYTWYCDSACITAGGGFVTASGVAGTATTQNPKFKAPATAGTYTVSLVVDDAGGSMANGEYGARDDASVGYNDQPLTFSTSFTVLP